MGKPDRAQTNIYLYIYIEINLRGTMFEIENTQGPTIHLSEYPGYPSLIRSVPFICPIHHI